MKKTKRYDNPRLEPRGRIASMSEISFFLFSLFSVFLEFFIFFKKGRQKSRLDSLEADVQK